MADIITSLPHGCGRHYSSDYTWPKLLKMRRGLLPFLLIATSVHAEAKPALLTCAEAANPKIVIQRCYNGDLAKGRYVGDLSCFPFSKPQRLTGKWRVELESSRFEQSPRQRERVWLEASDLPKAAVASIQGDTPRSFIIDIIGRRPLCRGAFGHMGMWDNEVLVDRFISIRQEQR